MSNDPRQQRHRPPVPSRWLTLMKVIIALGQLASVIRQVLRMDG